VSLINNKMNIFLSTTLLFFLSACSPVGDTTEEDGGRGAVSTSTSSSEIGTDFVFVNDTAHSHAASVVIGQADFTSSGDEPTSSDTVSDPAGNPTVVDGMLYLPDFGNNRAVGHNSVPTVNGKSANFAVGQANLVDSLSGSNEYHNEGVQTLTVYQGKLIMTDWGNSRILIYNNRPISEPAKADVVVGQTDFGQDLPAHADNRLFLPESLCVANGKLIVADSMNNRVLIWNTIPTTNGAAANIVLGQSNFTSYTAPNPPTASSLKFPTAVWSNGTMLALLDAGNNRILIWNSFPTTSNQAADVVLGQADFISKEANQGFSSPTASTLNFSTDGGGLYSNGIQLFVADSGNNRVLIWNFPLISTYNEPANGLIGQADFTRSGANREVGTPDYDSFFNPTGVDQFYDKLIVTDTGNNRYLNFNSL
jgi:hypothetical protein